MLSHRAIERELAQPLTVAAPLPKGDRQRWLIEKLVELGVSCFVPFETSAWRSRRPVHSIDCNAPWLNRPSNVVATG